MYRHEGRWHTDRPLTKDGIRRQMKRYAITREESKIILANEEYVEVYGIDIEPGGGAFVTRKGESYLNIWSPPSLEPVAGEWPVIERIIMRLCDNDEEAAEHLLNWLAYKVQNPASIPRTAVVFGTVQGGGKGTLFKIMSEILGADNCMEVGQISLESRFNGAWAGKLLVLGNEVVNNDNVKDVSERLKILIDSPRIEVEKKGQDVYTINNVTGWMFATNATTGGVKVEEGDRRFNVFTNFEPIEPDYREAVLSLFDGGGKDWSESGKAEVSAFFAFLKDYPVNAAQAGRPLDNDARDALISANVLMHDLFKQEVDEHGIDGFIKDLMDGGNYMLSRNRSEWDFGDAGVGIDVIYEAYVKFTQSRKGHPLKLPKFKTAMEVSHPKWEKVRPYIPGAGGKRRTLCYVVKRTPKGEPK